MSSSYAVLLFYILLTVSSPPTVLNIQPFLCTVLGEMFVVKIFSWGGEAQKLNAQIFLYSIHLLSLIIMGCHEPQKYFNTKILHKNIPHEIFPNYGTCNYKGTSGWHPWVHLLHDHVTKLAV